MRSAVLALVAFFTLACLDRSMGDRPPADIVPAGNGNITISPITHATVQVAYGPHVILVDPTTYAGYDGAGRLLLNFEDLPRPTLILVTDTHGDHFDPDALDALRAPATTVLGPSAVASKSDGALAIANGETRTVGGLTVEAVPMYNLQ